MARETIYLVQVFRAAKGAAEALHEPAGNKFQPRAAARTNEHPICLALRGSGAQGRYRGVFRGCVIGTSLFQTVRPRNLSCNAFAPQSRGEANTKALVIAAGLNLWRRTPEHITS